MFKQIFYVSQVRISQKVKGVLMWNLQCIIFIWTKRYKRLTLYLRLLFDMKTEILTDFQICISIPLKFTEVIVQIFDDDTKLLLMH